ncbi:uncharacterized protein B0I36DRAFT_321940 [Microdochium trichocladiopsis]|uniref:Tat pathway signal sequence n=1 Tax=Microdochium trichocladiopsis TaxID=1682393 RepID=A0A9P9BS72_9PEZI|nr:uncharacterized protein B0I36DRAFT_321940 [Microdochium trichocladiopsis]KAH7033716.1 hypothetical protein B0I36DRAFT_321940 [Microdochium trichocladiopsis]
MERLRGLVGYEKYEKIQLEDGDVPQPQDEDCTPSQRTPSNLTRAVAGFNLFFLVLNLFAFFKLYVVFPQARNQQLREQSFFSPIFDRLDIPVTTKTINASLANEDDSIWRKTPSPEVDAAWERVSKLGYHTISTADVLALGKDPSMTVRAPASWDRGDDAHIVQIDMTHQIHCLNAVRQAMYPEYYPVRKLMKDVHPQHCLHVLLQNLMCDASVNVMTYNWMETQQNPFPDMNIQRKCRDFDAVLDWHERTLVPLSEKVKKPEGVKQLPLTPKLKELLDAHKGESSDETVGGGHEGHGH